MKQFDIPEFYRSPIIAKVKARRKIEDPRKQDFSPTKIGLTKMEFLLPRHFGFCYGVENAIEKSYRAIQENPGKRIFLLSQMIHNPAVNEDLQANGITFLQDTHGNELIPFSSLTSEDIVIIPAFGTTLEIERALKTSGANITSYNTTCPFVEKVWNRSQKLGELEHTVIIHGKHDHEETRATFSHSHKTAPSMVIKNMEEAVYLGEVIAQRKSSQDFYQYFVGKYSQGFDPKVHLNKIGVVNQTTMLAIETQAITEYLRDIMKEVYGENALKERMADTRDTLCYATNDNQTSTYELAKCKPDFAVVVGGYNSSNTTHLVEILEDTMPVYFITGEECIDEQGLIRGFDIHEKKEKQVQLPLDIEFVRIAITSGASCPDAVVDRVMLKLMALYQENTPLENVINTTP
jgi:4-hydroxy-3-methylbut-2-enyl diphosphate reductase